MISVIVPVYNTEKYLEKCVRSIQNQVMTDIEIILVDDGSTDSSGKICDILARGDRRIKVIHKLNGGLVSARKAGVLSARGRYVGFVDSDDWTEKEMFQNMYQRAVQADADIVAGGYLEDIQGLCQSRKNVLKAGVYRSEEERAYFYKNMLNCDECFCLGIQPFLWNKLVRRELAERYILQMEDSIRVGEDAAVIYPAFLDAKTIVVLEDCHYHYCLRNASMSWKLERKEQELREVSLLHTYLEDRFSKVEENEVYGLGQQLQGYTINNMLVRAFGCFAKWKGERLFPFKGVEEGETVVLYGAGALGRAIYQYIEQSGAVCVSKWVDQNGEAYQRMGLPVVRPDELFGNNDKILIAVQKRQAVIQIRKLLMDMGMEQNQIVEGAFGEMWECVESLRT